MHTRHNNYKDYNYTLFQPHIRYGSAVWSGTTENNLQRVHILCQSPSKLTAERLPKPAETYTGEPVHIGSTNAHPRAQQEVGDKHMVITLIMQTKLPPVHSHDSIENNMSYIGAKVWNTLLQDLKRTDRLLLG